MSRIGDTVNEKRIRRRRIVRKCELVDLRIHGKEIIHIPNHRQLPRHIAHILIVQREVLTVKQRAAQQQEAQTIRAKLIHQLVRIGKVTE